jgi:hypothetical protein
MQFKFHQTGRSTERSRGTSRPYSKGAMLLALAISVSALLPGYSKAVCIKKMSPATASIDVYLSATADYRYARIQSDSSMGGTCVLAYESGRYEIRLRVNSVPRIVLVSRTQLADGYRQIAPLKEMPTKPAETYGNVWHAGAYAGFGYHGGYGYHRYGYGIGAAAVGVGVGAAIGAGAAAAAHCGYYPYGPCY